MTHFEFLEEFKKMIKRFEARYYPEEVVELIYEQTKALPLSSFRKIITIFLGQHKPALLPEFMEAIRLEKDRIKLETPKSETLNYDSMFTKEQSEILFKILKKASVKGIPRQQEFLDMFLPILDRVIKTRDIPFAANLFEELKTQPWIN